VDAGCCCCCCDSCTHRVRDLKHRWVVAHDAIAAVAVVARHFSTFSLDKSFFQCIHQHTASNTVIYCKSSVWQRVSSRVARSCNRILSSGGDVFSTDVVAALAVLYKPEIASSTSAMTLDDDVTLSPVVRQNRESERSNKNLNEVQWCQRVLWWSIARDDLSGPPPPPPWH
jgi:hypothetical protein